MHNYNQWFSNHYPKPPPFTYSPNAYHHPFNYAGHNPFLGTPNNYHRIHSNSLPSYWNSPPTPDLPGNNEFRRRGNTIYIIKRRPRVRRKSRHRKTKYGSSGGERLSFSVGRACAIKPDESGGEQLSFSVGRACGIKPDEDESESGSEEEYECPYAYVDSNGKINNSKPLPPLIGTGQQGIRSYYSAGKASCRMKPDESQFIVKKNHVDDEENEDEDESGSESESESESEEEVVNSKPPPPLIGIGQQASNYSAGKASCGMKADEAQFVKPYQVDDVEYEDEDEDEDEDESGSERDEDVFEYIN